MDGLFLDSDDLFQVYDKMRIISSIEYRVCQMSTQCVDICDGGFAINRHVSDKALLSPRSNCPTSSRSCDRSSG
jgi:hypothetical protein